MKKILVIEDNGLVRENICEILETENYKVFGCENGENGVEIANREVPDIVLCDVIMPGLDGYEVLKQLKGNPATENIPFVFLTAQSGLMDKQRARDLGAQDYIIKPFEAEDMLSIVGSKILESELRNKKFNLELSQYIFSLEEMLQMTSHRVRKPICNCLGLIMIFEKKDPQALEKDEFRKIMQFIKNSVLELDEYTRELTDFLSEIKAKYKDKIR
jgi:CheY-like chemotaxis protein